MKKLNELLEKHVLPVIPFKTAKDPNLKPWNSKLGGLPYLPQNCDYPKNINGETGHFLAQINLAECGHFPHLPNQGLLQFFISDWNDGYVHYYPEVLENEALLNTNIICPEDEDDDLPFVEEDYQGKIIFEALQYQKPTRDEIFFRPELIGEREINDELWQAISDWENEECFPNGNQIGGYPFFVQSDPRHDWDELNYILLFQLDSDNQQTNKWEINWGDGGVGAFFIPKDDLKHLDFSRVAFCAACF